MTLTPSELEVLKAYANNSYSVEDAARVLDIPKPEVKAILLKVQAKLDARSFTDAVFSARAKRVLLPDPIIRRQPRTHTGKMPDDMLEKFLSRIEKTETCWNWMKAKPGRYGMFAINHVNNQAHRLAYQHWVGEIPEKMVIDHLCCNTRCVNPDHLEAVTYKENFRRGFHNRVLTAQKDMEVVNGK